MSADAPVTAPAMEQVFYSGDVSRIAGVSLRQLQWLDERHVVSPNKDERRRKYGPQQVLEILTVAALRRKGVSLQRVRRLLRLLRRDLGQHFAAIATGSTKLYLLTDGASIHLEDQQTVLDSLAAAKGGIYVVCLTDLFRSITPRKPGRRSRSRQMQLF